MQLPCEDLNITHNADHTLSSFCKWQQEINPKDDGHPNHHDVAILITRMNIFSRMNESTRIPGLSRASGLCHPHRSCNINEDTGLAVAFTIAHELGHNFGMKDDTAENGCEAPTEGLQFVMAPQLTAEARRLVWSNCSQAAVTAFLDRDLGLCLDDEPSDHNFTFPVLPPGVMYDIDHQCRLQFGPKAEHCGDLDNVCATVWCRVDQKCVTKHESAAEGTLCADMKWCFGGRCVAIDERPPAIYGEWGGWSGWSECTRTCGAGVSYSDRLCNDPPPSHGGGYCVGERRRYRTCNTEHCPSNARTFREQQCSDFNNVPFKGQKYQWEPVSNWGTPCQLHCRPKDRQFSVMLKDTVFDGTPCRLGHRDMCISGSCRTIGCDWIINSDATEDRCGVCHGDGTTCKTVEKNFTTKSGEGYVEAAMVPAGALNIRVEEVAESNNYLAIRNNEGVFYLNGEWKIQWTGDYEAAGSVIRYRRDGNMESLVIPGPINEPLHVLLLFQSRNPGILTEYTLPDENVTERRRPEFRWKFSNWTHCTASCGGGNQVSKVVCFEKEAGIVDDIHNYCDPTKRPDDKIKRCNEHLCPAKWWTGPWQRCSVTCGDGGRQRRAVLCVLSHPGQQIVLEDWECGGLRPNYSLTCRGRGPCPTENSQWQAGPWIGKCRTDDPCSATQKRLVTCLRPNNTCDSKGKPVSKRPCPDTNCGGKWIVSEWTKCSVKCGGGLRHRNVTCPSQDVCDQGNRPNDTTTCNVQSCIQWQTKSWNKCSVSCGGGSQQRKVICFDHLTSQISDKCDRHMQPPADRECNTQQCPALEERSLPCASDAMATRLCHNLRRLGWCSLAYVQRKCCHSCRQWKRTQGVT